MSAPVLVLAWLAANYAVAAAFAYRGARRSGASRSAALSAGLAWPQAMLAAASSDAAAPLPAQPGQGA